MNSKRAKPTTTKRNPHHVILPWNDVRATGTIFAPDIKVINSKRRYMATFAIDNGKRPDGTLFDSIWMPLMMCGDLAERAHQDLIDKTRVHVYGRLYQTRNRASNKVYTYILADWYELQQNP